MSDFFAPISPEKGEEMASRIKALDRRGRFDRAVNHDLLEGPSPLERAAELLCCLALSGKGFAELYAIRKHDQARSTPRVNVFFKEVNAALPQRAGNRVLSSNKVDAAFAKMESGFFWDGLQSAIVEISYTGNAVPLLRMAFNLRAANNSRNQKLEVAPENILLDRITDAFAEEYELNSASRPLRRSASVTVLCLPRS